MSNHIALFMDLDPPLRNVFSIDVTVMEERAAVVTISKIQHPGEDAPTALGLAWITDFGYVHMVG